LRDGQGTSRGIGCGEFSARTSGDCGFEFSSDCVRLVGSDSGT